MTPLHYAKAIRTGLLMAAKARYEGGYRAACMLDAIARGDYSSAHSHWLMVELWVSQVDSINRLTLEMCRASRMPIHGGETTTRYEREEQVFAGGSAGAAEGNEAGTAPTSSDAGFKHSAQPLAILPSGGRSEAATLTTGIGVSSPSVQPLPAGPQTELALSPSYFPPVLRP
jgi:hypothetical protein